jgi:hypothetical protein
MNIFTIDSDNNTSVHATRKSAHASRMRVFDSAETLATQIDSNKRLVEIWNSLTGVTPVTRFTSRAVAVKRIFAELQKLAAPVAEGATGRNDETARRMTAAKRSPAPIHKPSAKAEPKTGSKKQIVLDLISRKNGASLEELTVALEWQKHSVRGFITTLRKTINIEFFKTDEGVRTYRTSQTG